MERVIHVPADSVNPYSRLVAQGLDMAGVSARLWFNPDVGRNSRRLLATLKQFELVHWHWLSRFYPGRRLPSFAARSGLFLSVLMELRARGIPQVLTVHNLLPHERTHEFCHRCVLPLIGNCVNLLHVHDETSIEPVSQIYGNSEKIRVVPHVDYGTPVAVDSVAQVRSEWGMEKFDKWAILFGGVRRYKRVELLLCAAGALNARGIGVVVAGACPDAEYERQLRSYCRQGQPLLILRCLSDSELSGLLQACNLAVFCHRDDSLTSGAAHLAIAHGLPIVAADSIAFLSFVRSGIAQTTLPEEPDVLAESIVDSLGSSEEERSKAIAGYRAERRMDIVGNALKAIYCEAGLRCNV